MTNIYVPDASVLLKWVLESRDEDDRERALTLRADWLAEKIDLRVPALWVFEVGNVLIRREAKLAGALLAALLDLRLDEVPAAVFASAACDFAQKYGVTFYDAAYHAVATSADGMLVTADSRFLRKVSRAERVMRLADYRSADVPDRDAGQE